MEQMEVRHSRTSGGGEVSRGTVKNRSVVRRPDGKEDLVRPGLFVAALTAGMLVVSSAGGASAGTRAETRVTIQTKRVPLLKARVHGTVQSERPLKCAKDRKVILFRQSGLEQHPKTDEKVAERRASPLNQGVRYVWSLTVLRPDDGRQLYYARVDSTEVCKAESTRTIHVIFAGA
jgi:hypothetical protein